MWLGICYQTGRNRSEWHVQRFIQISAWKGERAHDTDHRKNGLNDFEVSISLLWMVQESEDMFQGAEKVSGPQNMMRDGKDSLQEKGPLDLKS